MSLQKEKRDLEQQVQSLQINIRAKQLTTNSTNPLYSQMDDKSRRQVEQKDLEKQRVKDRIERTKQETRVLRQQQVVEAIINQNKGNKKVQEKFVELFTVRQNYEGLTKKKAALQEQIQNFYSIDAFGMISQELAERDLCVVDAALASQTKSGFGKTESNILFVNQTASQLILGNQSGGKIVNFDGNGSAAGPQLQGGLGNFHDHAFSNKNLKLLKR